MYLKECVVVPTTNLGEDKHGGALYCDFDQIELHGHRTRSGLKRLGQIYSFYCSYDILLLNFDLTPTLLSFIK